jgi:acyl carrier protein
MSIKNEVQKFILENYFFSTDESKLAFDESLLATGVIDSTGVLELILFIEDTFGIVVDSSETTPENLDSCIAIETYVLSKKAE